MTTDENICALTIIVFCLGHVLLIGFGFEHIWMLSAGWILGITFGGAATRADRARRERERQRQL